MLQAQGFKLVLASVVLLMLAQVPVRLIRASAPWLYLIGLLLLLVVAAKGDVAMGALARPWIHSLPTVRDNEDRHAARLRLVFA